MMELMIAQTLKRIQENSQKIIPFFMMISLYREKLNVGLEY